MEFIIETALKRLNLGGLTEKFETERITPVHEMEMLGQEPITHYHWAPVRRNFSR